MDLQNQNINTIKAGEIINSSHWPEPVIVKNFTILDQHVHIIGEYLTSGRHVDQIIPIEEFKNIQFISQKRNFTEKAWKVFLAIESKRYRFASLYDPLLAVNISKVDPLPHQIEAVYGYILKYPQIRFLIADDPGAGKTIMAGLIIKELKLRQLVKRILIISPGHLKDQWRRELEERFDEKFEVIDRNRFDTAYRKNIWNEENQVITSIDFAKRNEVRATLSASHFDLIIIDEAHKMSAYQYGEKINKSERYKLGETLSQISYHLLFLTATPHKGDPDNFRLFIDLLRPGFFATNEIMKESVDNKDNPLFLRRIKEDLRDFDGKPLFLPRHVKTISFTLGTQSPHEKELYNELSKYVENQYNLSISKNKKRNIAFALIILQRRLSSSTYALLKSLERRKIKLEDLLTNPMHRKTNDSEDFDDIDEMSEEERWEKESEWETVSAAETKEELNKEIQKINNLIQMAKNIIENEEEIKLTKLKESLQELSQKVQEKSKRKILIFTESRDTLDYLQNKIKKWGYLVNTIHGGMKLDERVKAESIFKNETEIMIATEAAGEGINLQFCNLMINYDIPWNPNRLEQRMGRIHRYGQTREVFVHNLVASDTREGRVLTRLFQKLDEIKNALGNDKVFDVLGEIIDSKQFSQAMMDAAVNARTIDEILQNIEITIDEEYIAKVKENLGETLATRYIDYTRIKELSQKAKEQRLIPEYTQSFFLKAFEKAGGKIKNIGNGFLAIESIPFEIRKIAEDEAFKKCYGSIIKKYPRTTFDKEVAQKNSDVEFISFGHPLFEAVMQWIEKEFNNAIYIGAQYYDPDCKLNGYILFFEGEITDGTGKIAGKRLFSFYINQHQVSSISPFILWDLAEENTPSDMDFSDIETLKQKTLNLAIQELEEYKNELLTERKRQAEIKKKYGVKSLEYLIIKLDNDLLELDSRSKKGENVDLVIYNKKERMNEYGIAKTNLSELIQKEQSLTMSMPKFIGIVKVNPLPGKTKEPEMIRDDEIEAIGMRIAMEYEKSQGRNPEDVSAQNIGFDIRSGDSSGNIRYIEVKARAATGSVELTPNEWFKAQRFGDAYYLYVVLNAAEKPELIIIQNPAQTIEPVEKTVRYCIDIQQITSRGIKP